MPPILGQDHALNILDAALDGGRVHHAWIFHGPEGVGKCTAARAFAKRLLEADSHTKSQWTAEPDWDHVDLHVIHKSLAAVSSITALRNRKQMNIPVDLLRERLVGGWVGSGDAKRYLGPIIARKAMAGGAKVFIVDEAELLAREGQNALLKTLEEPPPRTHLILVTSNEDRLLPTIRSRCQRVAFVPLDEDAMAAWFADHLRRTTDALQDAIASLESVRKPDKAQREQLKTLQRDLALFQDAPKQQSWILRFADGAPGRAALALHYGLGEWAMALEASLDQIAAGRAIPELGPQMADRVDRFAKTWVERNPGASKDAANKAAVRHMLGLLGQFCRRGLREAAPQLKDLDVLEADTRVAPWLAGVQVIDEAQRQLESNVSIPLLLENLGIQWSAQLA